MRKTTVFLFIFVAGFFGGNADDAAGQAEKSLIEPATTSTLTPASPAAVAASAEDAVKDKRQVGAKETQLYPNHRSDTVEDDPEDGQETIYGPKQNQFLIRPIAPHQHQQHEEHEQTHLLNYPATIRPHSQQQLLEQSQEFAYIQDVPRNHAKAAGAAARNPEKPQSAKTAAVRSAPQLYSATSTAAAAEEAEQRYAYAVQAPVPQLQPRQFKPSIPYQVSTASRQPQPAPVTAPQHQPQPQQQQPQQEYQVIPEEQFLKLIEEELQARAYQEAQTSQQHRQAQQQQPAQRHFRVPSTQSHLDSANKLHQAELPQHFNAGGLGNYRQRLSEEPNGDYIQYVSRPRGGPKYLPQAQQQHPLEALSGPTSPRLAYLKPTHPLTYKSSLPHHPLAKSSLEREIEKLLAANKPSAEELEVVSNSNGPNDFINQQHHQRPPPTRQQHKSALQAKTAFSTTPNALVDANNQPFVPSLFQFNNYQQPLPIHPKQVAPNVGPVVYPSTAPDAQPAHASQYYYQEAQPTQTSRPHRFKQYGNKIASSNASKLKTTHQKEAKLQSYDYDYEREPALQTAAGQLYSSPREPTEQQQKRAEARPRATSPAADQSPSRFNYNPFLLPTAAPSQSSIYVSQGTGITTPSRPIRKPAKKTAEDVRKLKLPQPGDKPLTQAEFQALIDAGYPVTAVPVPIPVPYEQYIKENPEHRSQTLEYSPMRLPQQYLSLSPRHQQQRLLAASSDPVGKADPKIATAAGPDGVTYLRPLAHRQQRHPRNEQDTAVSGKNDA